MYVSHSFLFLFQLFSPRPSFCVGVDIKECFIIYAAFCGLSIIQLLLMMMITMTMLRSIMLMMRLMGDNKLMQESSGHPEL